VAEERRERGAAHVVKYEGAHIDLRTMNELRARPRFYNTLTTCTTATVLHTRVNPQFLPVSRKVLLSGYVPEYLYKLGRLDTRRPFVELQPMSNVNRRAHAADQDPTFSQRILEGLPVPEPQR
jgi:hypothetical protein